MTTGPEHYKEAERFLQKAVEVGNIEAGRECLWAAQVHATLALAAATADQTVARGPGDVGPGWLEVLK